MKIAYLHQYFRTPSMSGGTRSFEMGRRLAANGHEVHIVTSTQDSTDQKSGWSTTQEAGLTVHWLSVPYSNHMRHHQRLNAFLRFAVAAGLHTASLAPEIVFASSTPLTIAISGVYASKRHRIPMVFEVRDLWPEVPIAVGALRDPVSKWLARQLEQAAYRNAAHIVALSPGMRDGIVATGYPPKSVTIIPNSCDFDLFAVDPEVGRSFRREHAWLQDRPLVVYAGTLGPINGVEYLVRLAAAVRAYQPEVRFLIVGMGKQYREVESLAARLGVLNTSLYMIPGMSKAEIPAVLSAASIVTSVFVDLKEMWNNSANKFFDALAAGRPIAINYDGWQADLIRETGAGVLLDVTDVESSAELLLSRLHDSAWLAKARKAAHDLGTQRFDRDALGAQLEHVLQDVVDDYRRRSLEGRR